MPRLNHLAYWFILIVVGCGEAKVIEFSQRPNRELFTDAQETMLKIGCASDGTGCHAVLVGNFKVSPFPKPPGDLDNEFVLTKPFIDLDEPTNSLLMRVALQDDPEAVGHAICFSNADSCAFRRLRAWIAYETPNDSTLEEACPETDIIENACFQ